MSDYWRVCYRALDDRRLFLYSTTSEASARDVVTTLNDELGTDRFHVEHEGSDYSTPTPRRDELT